MATDDNRHLVNVVVIILVGFATYFAGSWLFSSSIDGITAESILDDAFPPDEMVEHANEFNKPTIIKVTENVDVAVGYALANTIILNAPEGLIIVDTTESVEAARNVYQAIREMTDRPIRGIVYTHNHADHCYGTEAFVDNPEEAPEIWAHHLFHKEMNRFMATNLIMLPRSMRQFGALLPRQINAGIGARLEYNYERTMGLIFPTHLVYDEMDVEIAGLQLRFVPIPGETDDQIGIWLPKERVFLSADDIYKAFPNLYAIRGTPIRDVHDWLTSVDTIRYMRPQHLVPSHSRPVSGEQYIYDLLTIYRDAIQYVHDQTIRYMNKGMYPRDIVERVKLPERLRGHPYLSEMYGTVEWGVRTIFNQYLGWFSGDITELSSLNTRDRATRMITLAGGKKKIIAEASKALEDGDIKWALELSTQVLVLEDTDEEALAIRLEALKALARAQTSTNGRHYYLTTALEDYKLVKNKINMRTITNVLEHMSLEQVFVAIATRLDPEKALGATETAVFHFTDLDVAYTSYIRNNVNEIVQRDSEEFTVRLTMTSDTWRKLITKQVSGLSAYMSGEIQVDGGVTAFQRIFSYYDLITD